MSVNAQRTGTKLRRLLDRLGILGILERSGLYLKGATVWRAFTRALILSPDQRPLVKDYWSFRRRYGAFIKLGGQDSNPDKRVLLADLSGWLPTVKLGAVWMKALQLRGWTPIILTTRSPWARRYFRLFGYNNIICLDDFISSSVRAEAREQASSIMEQRPSQRELLDLRTGDTRTGRHVLSTVARQAHKGHFDPNDTELNQSLRETLERSLAASQAASCLLDRFRPHMALFPERGYTPFGEVFDATLSYGINPIFWGSGHEDTAFIFKRYTQETKSMHPSSLADETWDEVQRMPWGQAEEETLLEEQRSHYVTGAWFNRQQLQLGKHLKSREEQQIQLGLDPSKKTAVIFSHVLWDGTFFFGENLFEDYEDWLIQTVKAAAANRRLNWIVKLHPANVWRLAKDKYTGELREATLLREKIGPLPEHIKLLYPETDINTFSLFDLADYGLTVRGTIGLELPCFGVPVFTAGTGRYSGRGFTIDSDSRDDYLNKLQRIQEYPPLTAQQIELARRHAYAVFKLRPLLGKTAQCLYVNDGKTHSHLDPQVVIQARSLDDLRQAPDLSAFALWVEGDALDYMAHLNGIS